MDNIDGCQNCFCYGHGTSCKSAAGFQKKILTASSSEIDNWPWAEINGRRDFKRATWTGDFLPAYNNKITFEIQSSNTIKYEGATVYFDGEIKGQDIRTFYKLEPQALGPSFREISVPLHYSKWFLNETAQIDPFSFSGVLAMVKSLFFKTRLGSQLITFRNIRLETAVERTSGEISTSVEECQCIQSKNVGGRSCARCSKGYL